MANKKAKKNKDNKNVIIGAIVGVVALIVIIVLAVVLATRGSSKLDDSFFASDDTKYVATVDGDTMGMSDEEGIAPLKAHIVYFYSGDDVTDMRSYYEFADESVAKKFFDLAKASEEGDSSDNYELNGKYVILIADPTEYEGMKTSDAKEQIEFIEMLNNMGSGDYDDVDEEVDLVEEE